MNLRKALQETPREWTEIAAAAGVAYSTVWRIGTGRSKTFHRTIRQKLEAELGKKRAKN